MALPVSHNDGLVRKAEIDRRLLRDINELKRDPYPYISIYPTDDLTKACLVLTPEGKRPLHMTMDFHSYPYNAPRVTLQSKNVKHPNVFGDYICASILNTNEGYTPAYTIKGIAIQLLSFFNSDKIEQEYGGIVSLDQHQSESSIVLDNYVCKNCPFDDRTRRIQSILSPRKRAPSAGLPAPEAKRSSPPWSTFTDFHASLPIFNPESSSKVKVKLPNRKNRGTKDSPIASQRQGYDVEKPSAGAQVTLYSLPDEIMLLILDELTAPELRTISKSYSRVPRMLKSYDFIRMKELQCFFLKEGFLNAKLGVGVAVQPNRNSLAFSSEFDLLSWQAVHYHGINRSIHGIRFDHWLPLPLSYRHWRSVRHDTNAAIDNIATIADLPRDSAFTIIARFLNDIVVKFSQDTDTQLTSYSRYSSFHQEQSRSTLKHASEKAVEGYTSLFHLLLCLACEQPHIIDQADRMVSDLLAGETSKSACPNLGLLLVATLICTSGLTESLMRSIMDEAVKRNVVWMLDKKGAGMPELAYLEPSAVSQYRLEKTFAASKTSYRLLMFCHLFYRLARPDPSTPLSTIRDELFDRHGAPPEGVASQAAADIRRIKTIDSFPAFMRQVGMQAIPSEKELTTFLKEMVIASEKAGYSRMAVTQSRTYALRRVKEPNVEVAEGIDARMELPKGGISSFFPGGSKKKSKDKGGNAR